VLLYYCYLFIRIYAKYGFNQIIARLGGKNSA